jgi:mono/diheme cytochrome c family protein
VIRRWLSIALAGLIPAVFVAAFLAMAWVRSEQGRSEQVYPSEIEALAVRKEPADPLADARSRGRGVYQHYCQICHGEKGQGDGFNASRLQPPPRSFSDVKFWRQTSDERVSYAIAQGGPSVGKSLLMPAWGNTLSQNQIRDVMVFLRAFAAPPKAAHE